MANQNSSRTDHEGQQAHFIFLGDGKEPIAGVSWKQRRPSLEATVRHAEKGFNVGVVPASLGSTVLDFDVAKYPGIQDLHAEARAMPPPKASNGTRSGGVHHWHDAIPGHTRSKWHGGDVITGHGATGYVVLWDWEILNELAQLDAAGVQLGFPFPAELLPNVAETGPLASGTPIPPKEPELWGDVSLVKLPRPMRWPGDVPRGHRNNALADWARKLLGPASNRAVLDLDQLLDYLSAANARFTAPLPLPEVARIAVSAFGHSRGWGQPTAPFQQLQASRGRLSGAARREREKARDALIRWYAAGGWSQRRIAGEIGVTQQMVSYVLRRYLEHSL